MILNFLFFKYNGQRDVYMAKDWAVIWLEFQLS